MTDAFELGSSLGVISCSPSVFISLTNFERQILTQSIDYLKPLVNDFLILNMTK